MLNRGDDVILRPQDRSRVREAARGIALAGVAALAAAGAAFATAFMLLPHNLIFPVIAAGLLIAAATMALIAWASPPETGRSRIVYWDFAGVLTLIGLCAALIGEPEQAVALLERDR